MLLSDKSRRGELMLERCVWQQSLCRNALYLPQLFILTAALQLFSVPSWTIQYQTANLHVSPPCLCHHQPFAERLTLSVLMTRAVWGQGHSDQLYSWLQVRFSSLQPSAVNQDFIPSADTVSFSWQERPQEEKGGSTSSRNYSGSGPLRASILSSPTPPSPVPPPHLPPLSGPHLTKDRLEPHICLALEWSH